MEFRAPSERGLRGAVEESAREPFFLTLTATYRSCTLAPSVFCFAKSSSLPEGAIGESLLYTERVNFF